MSISLVTRLFRWIRANRITRFEFLLPTKYNDGTVIEPTKLDRTNGELVERFGGLRQDLVGAKGFWMQRGTVYGDELWRIRLDTGDSDAIPFLKRYKEKLKERFQQLDLWITAHELEVI